MFLIPLAFQLLYSYQPSYYYSPINFSTPTPILPFRSSEGAKEGSQILGISTTTTTSLPPIGGEGQIATIALIGDSMIQTLGDDVPSLNTALQKYYPRTKFNLLNFGRGATTLTFAKNHLPTIISQQPDIIVLESFAYNNYGNTQAGFDQHWQDLESIISTINQQSPHTQVVLAATIAPDPIRFANGVKDLNLTSLGRLEKTTTIKLYLENLIKLAKNKNLPLANAYHPSLVNNSANPDFIDPTDHIHPSATGANFFASILAKTIFDHHLL